MAAIASAHETLEQHVHDHPTPSTCKAENFVKYIGDYVDNIPESERPATMIALGPMDANTPDHIPNRLRLMTDISGKILEITCG